MWIGPNRTKRVVFFFSMVRFPRIIKCGRMLMTRKCRRRLFHRSPYLHARFLAKLTAHAREMRARSLVCCFELLYVFPFYSHLPLPLPPLTETNSTLPRMNLPNPTPPSLHSTRPFQLNRRTPKQHPHYRRLRRRGPLSRIALPPPPSPLYRCTSTTDHRRPLPAPRASIYSMSPWVNITNTDPSLAPNTPHDILNSAAILRLGERVISSRMPPSQWAYVRLATQSSLGVV